MKQMAHSQSKQNIQVLSLKNMKSLQIPSLAFVKQKLYCLLFFFPLHLAWGTSRPNTSRYDGRRTDVYQNHLRVGGGGGEINKTSTAASQQTTAPAPAPAPKRPWHACGAKKPACTCRDSTVNRRRAGCRLW